MASMMQEMRNGTADKPYRLTWKEMGEFRNDQVNKMAELTDRLGQMAHVTMFGIHIHLVSDPKMIREILIRHANQLHKDRFTKHMFNRMLGHGIVTTEDEPWQKQRKLMQPMFHATSINDFTEVFVAQAQEMCNRWQLGKDIRLEQEMMGLTLRVICRTMFSEDIDGLKEKLGELLNVMITEAQSQLAFGLTIPNWMPLPTYRRQDKAIAGIHALLLDIIQRRKAAIQSGDPVPSDLLTMLLTAKYDDGSSMTETQVLDECMTIFFAGHETTAVGLSWTWVELLRHPEVLKRLVAEIENRVGDRPVSYTDLEQLPYLGQVVKESLRLHPPVAAFSRTPKEAFDVEGHHFKPKDMLVFCVNTVHHLEEFYPEPGSFAPERFAPDKEQPDRYTYLPFGAGSRICIGNAFAMLEMQIVLATMLQSLRLSLVPGQAFIPEQLITLRPRDGVKVKVVAKK